MRCALVGMPNCGKTTLFNRLTGSIAKTGNLPGVTVDVSTAAWSGRPGDTLTDLPGIYSLRPTSEDERVTRDALLEDRPELLIAVIDACAPRQGLALLAGLLPLGIPTVVAVNRMDELTGNGGVFHAERLSRHLSLPVYPVSAITGTGIPELTALTPPPSPRGALPDASLARLLEELSRILSDEATLRGVPARFLAEAFYDGDPAFLSGIPEKVRSEADRLCHADEKTGKIDRSCRLRAARYRFSGLAADGAFCSSSRSSVSERTERVDRLLLHPLFGFPLFLFLLSAIFLLTFAVFGPVFDRATGAVLSFLGDRLGGVLCNSRIPPPLSAFFVKGIYAGIGSVISFLPTLLFLFFLLSLLESSGYLARAALLADRSMRRIGLGGRCIVPILLGFGCTVPSVMACRTIPDLKQKRRVVALIPFMSCSAKLPVFFFLTSALFGRLAVLSVILVVFGCALLGFLLIALLPRRGKAPAVPAELPPYRMPTLRDLRRRLRSRSREFLSRAATAVLPASVFFWFLGSYTPAFRYLPEGGDASILFLLGNTMLPLLRPLGIRHPYLGCALLAGLFAKEAVLGTLASLGAAASFPNLLPFPSSVAFLSFLALYPPCVAAFSVTCREVGRGRTWFVSFLRLLLAWLLSAILFRLLS